MYIYILFINMHVYILHIDECLQTYVCVCVCLTLNKTISRSNYLFTHTTLLDKLLLELDFLGLMVDTG